MVNNNSQKFEEIYETYWQKIYRVCMGYVNDPDRAKDIAQDTFVTVLQQLPKFRNESSVGTWIFRIASNHCLRQIEKDKRMPKEEIRESVHENIKESTHENIQTDTNRRTEFLYKSISGLPETDRLIISLELEDIKQSEIAGIMGLSEANVRVRIHRIKEKLTEKFKSYED